MLGMELISVLFSTLFSCNINEHLCSKIAGLKGIPIANDLAVYFQFAKQATRYQLSSHWGWEEDAQEREGMENRGSGSCYVPGGCHRKAGEGAEKQAASKEAKAKLCVVIPFLWQIKQHFWKGHQSFARSWSLAPVAAATGLHLKWGPRNWPGPNSSTSSMVHNYPDCPSQGRPVRRGRLGPAGVWLPPPPVCVSTTPLESGDEPCSLSKPPSLLPMYTLGPWCPFLLESFVRALLVLQNGSNTIEPQNGKGQSLNPLPSRRHFHSYRICIGLSVEQLCRHMRWWEGQACPSATRPPNSLAWAMCTPHIRPTKSNFQAILSGIKKIRWRLHAAVFLMGENKKDFFRQPATHTGKKFSCLQNGVLFIQRMPWRPTYCIVLSFSVSHTWAMLWPVQRQRTQLLWTPTKSQAQCLMLLQTPPRTLRTDVSLLRNNQQI